jgi:3-mercaptopyruvate sulfurtransferase SseA
MMDDLDSRRPLVVHCAGGYRSSAATSLLQRAGYRQVMNVTGGFGAWKAAGLPVTTPDAAHNYVASWSAAKVEDYSERQLEVCGWPVN